MFKKYLYRLAIVSLIALLTACGGGENGGGPKSGSEGNNNSSVIDNNGINNDDTDNGGNNGIGNTGEDEDNGNGGIGNTGDGDDNDNGGVGNTGDGDDNDNSGVGNTGDGDDNDNGGIGNTGEDGDNGNGDVGIGGGDDNDNSGIGNTGEDGDNGNGDVGIGNGGNNGDGNGGNNGNVGEILHVRLPKPLCGEGSLKFNSNMKGYEGIALGVPEGVTLTLENISGDFYYNPETDILIPSEHNLIHSVTVTLSEEGYESKTITYDIEYRAGSEEDPFAICSAADLKAINYKNSNYPNYDKSFIMLADVNIGGENWEPIGKNLTNPFKGTFDGNGHSIKNMLISKEAKSNYTALFGYVTKANKTVIKNLNVEGRVTVGDSSAYTAMIVGYISGNMENVSAEGEITTGASAVTTGGLAGHMYIGSKIESAYFHGNINADGWYTGGLVGYAGTYTKLNSVYTVGQINVVNGNIYTGGIVGHIAPDNGAINSAYSAMDINSGTSAQNGGIAGYVDGAKIRNSVVLSRQITSSAASTGRIAGSDAANLASNYAYANMELPHAAVSKLTGRDGAHVQADSVVSPLWWEYTAWAEGTWNDPNVWDISNAGNSNAYNLPILVNMDKSRQLQLPKWTERPLTVEKPTK